MKQEQSSLTFESASEMVTRLEQVIAQAHSLASIAAGDVSDDLRVTLNARFQILLVEHDRLVIALRTYEPSLDLQTHQEIRESGPITSSTILH